jgi:hypothetical protein
MKYSKPEVRILGNAVAVITDMQGNPKKSNVPDGTQGAIHSVAAYDLDE